MKKFLMRILSAILSVAFVCSLVGCSETTESSGSDTKTGIVYEIVGSGEDAYASVKEYALSEEDAKTVANGNYKSLMVDLTINEYTAEDGTVYPVKEVQASAFANKLVIKSVTFGENVETIGAACLAGCANLEKLSVYFVGTSADAVNDGKVLGSLFGTAAFDGGYSVTMSYNATGSKSFYLPEKLKEVTVCGTALSDYAFYATNIEKVNLTGAVETIGKYAFYGMKNLTTYTVPASVKTIGNYAFADCANLTTVKFAQGSALTTIGKNAFEDCSLLGYGANNDVTFPATLSNLGEKAFYNCKQLKAVNLSMLATVSEYAFYGCEELTAVTLAENANLCTGAFGACKKLEKTAVVNIDTATGTDEAFDLVLLAS